MREFEYDSDDFDINFDDPGETSNRNADAVEPMNITPGRIEYLIVCRDYWMSRSEEESYKLCEKFPQPQSKEARYKIYCAKHQNPKVNC